MRKGLWIFLLSATAAGQTVPYRMTYTGKLEQNNAPVTGTYDVTFRLFENPTGGSAVWSESITNVMVTDGIFSLELGSSEQLDPTVLTGEELWLQVEVDETALLPRVPLRSVAYAVRADVANMADDAVMLGGMAPEDFALDAHSHVVDYGVFGSCTSEQKVTGVNGTTGAVICDDENDIADGSVTFAKWSDNGCNPGDIPKWNASTTIWECAADSGGGGTVTSIASGAGLTGGPITSTGTLSIASNSVTSSMLQDGSILFADWHNNGCTANDVPRWTGTAWACAADAFTDNDTDTHAGTICTGTGTYLDGEGNCDTGVSDVACTTCIGTTDLADDSVTSAKVAFNYAASTSEGGAASDLSCTDCVSSLEVGFNYAGSTSEGGAADDLSCTGCVSSLEVGFNYAGSSSAGGAATSAADLACSGCVDISTETTGTLGVPNGGTGATTASAARTSLGAAASGSNSDITSLGAVTSVASPANDPSLVASIAVNGSNSTTHTISLQIDGNTGLSVAATGDGAGSVGPRTISAGVSSAADVLVIGDANADVTITDANWSISSAGAASFASLTVGSGDSIQKVLTGTASLNFGATPANSCEEDANITVTGAAVGDSVHIGTPAAPEAGSIFWGYVSAANAVTVRRCNVTGSALSDPAPETYRATIVQF